MAAMGARIAIATPAVLVGLQHYQPARPADRQDIAVQVAVEDRFASTLARDVRQVRAKMADLQDMLGVQFPLVVSVVLLETLWLKRRHSTTPQISPVK
jgi:hypothetical protein